MPRDEYLHVNRTNWDSRAAVHAQGYGIDRLLADPHHLTGVVELDPGLMVLDDDVREYRLRDRRERFPATFTLTARRR